MPPRDVPEWVQEEFAPHLWQDAATLDAEFTAEAEALRPQIVDITGSDLLDLQAAHEDAFWDPIHEEVEGTGIPHPLSKDPKYHTDYGKSAMTKKQYREMLKRKREHESPTVADILKKAKSMHDWDHYLLNQQVQHDYNTLGDEGRFDESLDPFGRLMDNRVGFKRKYDDLLDEWDF